MVAGLVRYVYGDGETDGRKARSTRPFDSLRSLRVFDSARSGLTRCAREKSDSLYYMRPSYEAWPVALLKRAF